MPHDQMRRGPRGACCPAPTIAEVPVPSGWSCRLRETPVSHEARCASVEWTTGLQSSPHSDAAQATSRPDPAVPPRPFGADGPRRRRARRGCGDGRTETHCARAGARLPRRAAVGAQRPAAGGAARPPARRGDEGRPARLAAGRRRAAAGVRPGAVGPALAGGADAGAAVAPRARARVRCRLAAPVRPVRRRADRRGVDRAGAPGDRCGRARPGAQDPVPGGRPLDRERRRQRGGAAAVAERAAGRHRRRRPGGRSQAAAGAGSRLSPGGERSWSAMRASSPTSRRCSSRGCTGT